MCELCEREGDYFDKTLHQQLSEAKALRRQLRARINYQRKQKRQLRRIQTQNERLAAIALRESK